MSTEGWGENTGTHILGIRGFGTQPPGEVGSGEGQKGISQAATGSDSLTSLSSMS
jgi:hypothetical protein